MGRRGAKRPQPQPEAADPRKRRSRKVPVPEVTDPYVYHTPKNPQAWLCGIPAELRLEIYAHSSASNIIHLHWPAAPGELSRFYWTPCRGASSISPLLCANPKWSGMCEEKDRCTHKTYAPPAHVGFWGLAATNKTIREEARGFFFRNAVRSISPGNVSKWISPISHHYPDRLRSIRRVTIAGPSSTYLELGMLVRHLPNLEAVGIQLQERIWNWTEDRYNNEPWFSDDAWRQSDIVKRAQETLDDSITVALELLMFRKSGVPSAEHQVVIRVVRKGKSTKDGAKLGTHSAWTDKDVKVEIDRAGRLAEPSKKAEWRLWWRGTQMDELT